MSPWAYPENRYYYEWYDADRTRPASDGEIKQDVLIRSAHRSLQTSTRSTST